MEKNENVGQSAPIKNVELGKYTTKGWLISLLLGFFIGLAIIVPGVSGATIAIIFGLYAKMVFAFSNLTRGFKKSFAFLLPIGIGALIGFLVGFFAVQKLIELMPFTIVCLFAGLMIGAFPAVTCELKGTKPTASNVILALVGLIIPIALAVGSLWLTDGATGAGLNVSVALILLYIPLGAVLSITQILPGLSATAVMMAVGQFRPLMASLHLSVVLDNPIILLVILALVLGFVIGLLAFSKLLNFLLTYRKTPTFYTIVGLSAGSIVSMFVNPDIFEVYGAWGQGSSMWLDLTLGFVLMALGAICAFLLVKFELRRKAEKIKEDKNLAKNAEKIEKTTEKQ